VITGIVIFYLGAQPTDNNAPNPWGGLLGIGMTCLLLGFPSFTATLIGGAIRTWPRQGRSSKLLAVFMIVAAIPFLLYSLALFLASAGVINLF
jgi:hypothetical protein